MLVFRVRTFDDLFLVLIYYVVTCFVCCHDIIIFVGGLAFDKGGHCNCS